MYVIRDGQLVHKSSPVADITLQILNQRRMVGLYVVIGPSLILELILPLLDPNNLVANLDLATRHHLLDMQRMPGEEEFEAGIADVLFPIPRLVEGEAFHAKPDRATELADVPVP